MKHEFVDESRRQQFMLCTVRADSRDLGLLRQTMRSLLRNGQRRVHFVKESPSRRRSMIDAIARLPVQARIYRANGPDIKVRPTCMTRLVSDALGDGVRRLVIEPVEGFVRDDIAAIYRVLNRDFPEMSYEHLLPHEEVLLGLPDAIAWAFGAGGDWRRRVDSVIDRVEDVGA